ncbi:MAG: family 1 glycosylhydrolase [Clostridia bacterium]|nr:family 1 glycosylhydrolase [Clostridia bacterium]
MFKKEFLFGVSTAAAQVEGDDGTQGRGKSIWDTFCDEGRIYKNQTAKISVDHYNRYEEDINLMADLGVNAYRFSTSWSRLLPEGIGAVNQKGIDFYNRLIDTLLKKNIQPILTLYHWDLPQALSEKGGFENPDFVKWFTEYSALVADKYGDRLKTVISFNEPINIINSGYKSGVFAPGKQLGDEGILKCILHMHKAHGECSQILRAKIKDLQLGLAVSTFEEYPVATDEKTLACAKKRFFEKDNPAESVDVYLDPLYFGEYPKRIYEKYPAFQEVAEKADLKKYVGNTNIIGYNNYSGMPIDSRGEEVKNYLLAEYTDMCGTVDPNGMYWGIKFLTERYKSPLYITENGVATQDWMFDDGKVHDVNRCEYLKRHLAVVSKLLEEKMDIRGYFVWSFTDNFEWIFGYSKRFGLVHINYETLKRTPKDSYYWYQEFIAKNKTTK